jgi:hypothetical protein
MTVACRGGRLLGSTRRRSDAANRRWLRQPERQTCHGGALDSARAEEQSRFSHRIGLIQQVEAFENAAGQLVGIADAVFREFHKLAPFLSHSIPNTTVSSLHEPWQTRCGRCPMRPAGSNIKVGARRDAAHQGAAEQNSRGRHEPRRNTRAGKDAQGKDGHPRHHPGRRQECNGPLCCAEMLGHGNTPKVPDPCETPSTIRAASPRPGAPAARAPARMPLMA